MKTLLAAVLLAGSVLGTSAPPARAAAVTGDCGFNTVAQEDVTGGSDTFTGAAYGYAVSDTAGASISVWCEVRVNGGTVDATDPGPSGQASFTLGQVTYVATDTDTVTLCAVWTGSESGELCGATTTQQIPPPEVTDLLMTLSEVVPAADIVVTILCPVLASMSPGVPGVVDIAADGDIRSEVLFMDCPPYGSSAFTGPAAAADPLICVELWQYSCHPWIHVSPCHAPPRRPCGSAATTRGSR